MVKACTSIHELISAFGLHAIDAVGLVHAPGRRPARPLVGGTPCRKRFVAHAGGADEQGLIHLNRRGAAAQRIAASQRKICQGRLTPKRSWLSRSVAGRTRPFAHVLNPGGDGQDDHHTGIGRAGAWLVP
jgi:hypothetical protein